MGCCAQATSELVRSALLHVKYSFPYWNATNGADHFMVFSYDHGRCEMARDLHSSEFGEMFAIQAYGSLVYRCAISGSMQSDAKHARH